MIMLVNDYNEEEKEKEDDIEIENTKESQLISKEISKCLNIFSRSIDLSGLKISILPTNFYDLIFLQHLYLSNNQIIELPINFFKYLECLKWLDLRNNLLKVFPSMIPDQHPLENLLMENNNLTELPTEIGKFFNLKSLNIKNNSLTFPPIEIIKKGTKFILNFLRNILIEKGEIIAEPKEMLNVSHLNNCEQNKKKQFSKLSAKQILKTQSEKYIDEFSCTPVTELKLEQTLKKEKKMAKIKAENIRQDKILQDLKTKDLVNEWKDDYKKMKANKEMEKRLYGLDYIDPVASAPFAVKKEDFRIVSNEERIEARMNNEIIEKPQPLTFEDRQRIEIARLHYEQFLKEKTSELLTRLRIKEENETKNTEEALLIAQENLQYARKLQEEIQQCRRALEYGLNPYPV